MHDTVVQSCQNVEQVYLWPFVAPSSDVLTKCRSQFCCDTLIHYQVIKITENYLKVYKQSFFKHIYTTGQGKHDWCSLVSIWHAFPPVIKSSFFRNGYTGLETEKPNHFILFHLIHALRPWLLFVCLVIMICL